jgi:hypothetical protein
MGETRTVSAWRCCDDTGQQVEVVVDDVGMNGLAGDVYQSGPGLTEEEEQEEVPLLVGLELTGAQLDVDVGRGHHHDGLFVGVEMIDRRPQRHQLLLKGVICLLIVRVEVRWRGHPGWLEPFGSYVLIDPGATVESRRARHLITIPFQASRSVVT